MVSHMLRCVKYYQLDLKMPMHIPGTGHWSEGALVRRVTGPKVI